MAPLSTASSPAPAAVDLGKVAAHYAITSLFKPYAEHARIYCYSVDRVDSQSLEAGRMKLGLGRARFTSEITQESEQLIFAALHFGDHNLQCGTHVFRDEETYRKLVQDMTSAFSRADVPEVLRLMDKELGSTYSLKSLFRDDRRAILQQILNTSLEEAEAAYRQIYEHHVPLAHFLRDLGVPLPKAIRTAAEFALNSHLRRAFGNEEMDLEQVRKLLEEARPAGSSSIPRRSSTRSASPSSACLNSSPPNPATWRASSASRRSSTWRAPCRSRSLLWTPQNVWSEVRRAAFEERSRRAQEGDDEARTWVEHFQSLGEKLKVRVTEGATVQAQTG